jgi:hypothetical protein
MNWRERARARVLELAAKRGDTLSEGQVKARMAGRLIGRGAGEVLFAAGHALLGVVKNKASAAVSAILPK